MGWLWLRGVPVAGRTAGGVVVVRTGRSHWRLQPLRRRWRIDGHRARDGEAIRRCRAPWAHETAARGV